MKRTSFRRRRKRTTHPAKSDVCDLYVVRNPQLSQISQATSAESLSGNTLPVLTAAEEGKSPAFRPLLPMICVHALERKGNPPHRTDICALGIPLVASGNVTISTVGAQAHFCADCSFTGWPLPRDRGGESSGWSREAHRTLLLLWPAASNGFSCMWHHSRPIFALLRAKDPGPDIDATFSTSH